MYSAAVSPAASASGTVRAGRSSASAIVHRAAPGGGKMCAAGAGGTACSSQACSTAASRSRAFSSSQGLVMASTLGPQTISGSKPPARRYAAPSVPICNKILPLSCAKKHGCASNASLPKHMTFVFCRSFTAASKRSSRARQAAKAALPSSASHRVQPSKLAISG